MTFLLDTNVVSELTKPTTMIAAALLLLPFGVSTLRILRKNRVAYAVTRQPFSRLFLQLQAGHDGRPDAFCAQR